MKTQKLSLDFLKSTDYLTREEKKNILAGSGSGGYLICKIYYPNHGGWTGCGWTVEQAQYLYSSLPEVTGYCCASCSPRCY